ncbi:MAG: DUF2238 domain-containing protein [Woeseiaceae bacterium]|nr:DUF2238 domain-containing protein [Woeseiaceae bacterium]
MSIGAGVWALVFAVVAVWSGINPKDVLTWFLEALPALLAAAILAGTRRRFPLTPLTYVLILLHCIILLVGAHYTYSDVPLGEWVADWFDHGRNNYDKLGHLAQGFVPAIVAREIVLRLVVFRTRAWMNFFIVAMCLGISAFYELIEWWVALLSDQAADAFLGTQGFVWDTQSDMLLALIGAIAALATLARWHDAQLARFG